MAPSSFTDHYPVKLNFLADFSHELRTPLAQILGPVEQLQNSDATLSEGERKRLYRIIGLHTTRILDLVDQLLDVRSGGHAAPGSDEAAAGEASRAVPGDPADDSPRQAPVTRTGRRCSSYDDELLSRLGEIMEAHLDDTDFNVHKMCSMVHLSHMHFIRKVKQLTGKKPIDLLKSFRLQRAKDLLGRHNLTVAEVAYRVGYDMPNSFSRAFKKEFGMSPSAYLGGE